MLTSIHLKVLLPSTTFLDREVDQVTAEGANGHFSLEPRHVDFVAALVPGIFSFVEGGLERFMAVNAGMLVKRGGEVLVSTRDATRVDDLGRLRTVVREHFAEQTEHEAKARTALARMEAGFIRGLLEQQKYG
jgi:F-type H+-transporting ATPase subunit epsilon